MKITVIGCGNAFSDINYNQSFILEEQFDAFGVVDEHQPFYGKRRLLVDCGLEIPHALFAAKIKVQDINDIYVSHLHADHIGGLEKFAFLRYDWANKPRKTTTGPYLIGNKQLLDDLWNKSLRGGLESMEGFVSNLETFFRPFPVEPNTPFYWCGWRIDLIQQIHIMSGSIIMPSFGIFLTKEGHKSVYIVTDSQHCSPRQIEEYYKRADIIFQDCELVGVDFRFQEGTQVYKVPDFEGTWEEWGKDDPEGLKRLDLSVQGINPEPWAASKMMSGVHANYAQLAGYPSANSIKLPTEIKAKMYLSHYQDFLMNNKDMYGHPVNWEEQAKKDGFAGFVSWGETFEV